MAYKLEPLERSFGAVITEIDVVNIQEEWYKRKNKNLSNTT